MLIPIRRAAIAVLVMALAGCAATTGGRILVDPFPLRLPLAEAGSLEIDGHIIGQPRVRDGILYYAARGGYLTELVVSSRSVLRRYEVDDGSASASASPDTRVGAGGRVYFGSGDRMFYCLDAATGKTKWKRRLQGAPLHPPIVADRRIAVVASNSTLYFLSARGGSILSWEAIPSRVVFEPARAGTSLLVSPAADRLFVFDLRTGERIGQHLTSGTLVAGAVWSSPYVILFEEAPDTGRQRIVFLRSR
jgi:outer membrane protein assembly factor BamB